MPVRSIPIPEKRHENSRAAFNGCYHLPAFVAIVTAIQRLPWLNYGKQPCFCLSGVLEK